MKHFFQRLVNQQSNQSGPQTEVKLESITESPFGGQSCDVFTPNPCRYCRHQTSLLGLTGCGVLSHLTAFLEAFSLEVSGIIIRENGVRLCVEVNIAASQTEANYSRLQSSTG